MKNSGDPINPNEFAALQRSARTPQIGGDGGVSITSNGNGLCIKGRSPVMGVPNEAAFTAVALNTDSVDLLQYQPCEIVGSITSGDDLQWKRQLEIQSPTSDAMGKFGVCQGNIDAGYGGNIFTSGTCLCWVQTDSGDTFADISPSDGFLKGDPKSGGAQILWEDGGSSMTTHLALIRFPAGGAGGDSRWSSVTGWTAAPSTATKILLTNTSSFAIGSPVRYTTVAGGTSTYFYCQVITIVANTSITILGKSLTGVTLTSLDVGHPELIVQVDFYVPGLFAATTGNKLALVGKTYFVWQFPPASLVTFMGLVGTAGGGTNKINLVIGSTSVDSSGVVPTTAGVVSSAIVAGAITHGQFVEVAVTVADTTAMDLTISAVFILA